jgi:hypothetical protein
MRNDVGTLQHFLYWWNFTKKINLKSKIWKCSDFGRFQSPKVRGGK